VGVVDVGMEDVRCPPSLCPAGNSPPRGGGEDTEVRRSRASPVSLARRGQRVVGAPVLPHSHAVGCVDGVPPVPYRALWLA
jgi:hypothetical protein